MTRMSAINGKAEYSVEEAANNLAASILARVSAAPYLNVEVSSISDRGSAPIWVVAFIARYDSQESRDSLATSVKADVLAASDGRISYEMYKHDCGGGSNESCTNMV